MIRNNDIIQGYTVLMVANGMILAHSKTAPDPYVVWHTAENGNDVYDLSLIHIYISAVNLAAPISLTPALKLLSQAMISGAGCITSLLNYVAHSVICTLALPLNTPICLHSSFMKYTAAF